MQALQIHERYARSGSNPAEAGHCSAVLTPCVHRNLETAKNVKLHDEHVNKMMEEEHERAEEELQGPPLAQAGTIASGGQGARPARHGGDDAAVQTLEQAALLTS